MKHKVSGALMRLVLASALLFVLAGLAPASTSASAPAVAESSGVLGNQGYTALHNTYGLWGAASGLLAAPVSSGNFVYVVKPGDTLARIAARYGVTVQALLYANPSIHNADRIYIGQRIVIPGSTNTGGKTFNQVNIYLIGIGAGKLGCGDQAVPVKVNVPATQAPLTAALQQLLSLHDQHYGQSGLYNALYQSHLTVQTITRNGTVWNVYLRGTLQLGGVCDIPRVEAQLQRTALQFATVTQVRYFVNGVPLKDALSQK